MPLDPRHLRAFKADVLTLTSEEIFERYVAPEACMGFTNLDERSLRQRVGDRFEIPIANVYIVGSAKIGFTLTPKKGRPVYSAFRPESDVDVAIVSDAIFDRAWKECLRFWHGSGYRENTGYWAERGKDFRSYHFRGWMRPDKLPSGGALTYANEWFDFFRQLVSDRVAGDSRINAGVYRERHFLEMYQRIAIDGCKARHIR